MVIRAKIVMEETIVEDEVEVEAVVLHGEEEAVVAPDQHFRVSERHIDSA